MNERLVLYIQTCTVHSKHIQYIQNTCTAHSKHILHIQTTAVHSILLVLLCIQYNCNVCDTHVCNTFNTGAVHSKHIQCILFTFDKFNITPIHSLQFLRIQYNSSIFNTLAAHYSIMSNAINTTAIHLIPSSSPSSQSHFYAGSMYDDTRLHVNRSYTYSPGSPFSEILFDIISHNVPSVSFRPSTPPTPL